MIVFLKIQKVSSFNNDEISEVYGEESKPKFYMHRDTLKPFHLDYILVSNKWITKTTLKVGKSNECVCHSDLLSILEDVHSH